MKYPSLPWYEQDNLMTYIDELKYKQFLKDLKEKLENSHIIKFDIIHNKSNLLHNKTEHYKKIKKMIFLIILKFIAKGQ